ncbi:uncharacterized protein JCM6883_003904 [Sporobolomyces salmoneus]|uniref:uncharacterized protein n=1 Tax=Sporobolomyces salmoneus TaxID=183962 RepID=UPI00317B5226
MGTQVIDLSLTTDDESDGSTPPIASTSRSTVQSQAASVNNPNSRANATTGSAVAGSSRTKGTTASGRHGINVSQSTFEAGSSSQHQGRTVFEISNDSDEGNGTEVPRKRTAAAGTRRIPTAARKSTAGRPPRPVVIDVDSDTDSDSSLDFESRPPPSRTQPDAPVQPRASTSTSQGRPRSSTVTAGSQGSAQTDVNETPRAKPKSTLFSAAIRASVSRSNAKPSPSAQPLDQTPRAGNGNGKGKEKAVDQDSIPSHDDNQRPELQSLGSPSRQKQGARPDPAISASTASPSTKSSNLPTSKNPDSSTSAAAQSQSLPSTSAASLPATAHLISPQKPPLPIPSPQTQTKPLPPDPSPSKPIASTSRLSPPTQSQNAPPLKNNKSEVLYISSSSERGDSEEPDDPSSDLEIVSSSIPVSTRPQKTVSDESSKLEIERREEQMLERLQKQMEELRARKAFLQEQDRLAKETKKSQEEADRVEKERLETERLEKERIERERVERIRYRIERERLERERVEEEKRIEAERIAKEKEEETRRIEEESAREREVEEKARLEEAARARAQEEETRKAREDAESARQAQEREEAEELDHFCDVELPRLEEETRAFRSTLADQDKNKWDDVLYQIIASEGVSTAAEYRGRVDKAKTALAALLEMDRIMDLEKDGEATQAVDGITEDGTRGAGAEAEQERSEEREDVDDKMEILQSDPPSESTAQSISLPPVSRQTTPKGFADDADESSSDDEVGDQLPPGNPSTSLPQQGTGFAEEDEISEDDASGPSQGSMTTTVAPTAPKRAMDIEMAEVGEEEVKKPIIAKFASDSDSDDDAEQQVTQALLPSPSQKTLVPSHSSLTGQRDNLEQSANNFVTLRIDTSSSTPHPDLAANVTVPSTSQEPRKQIPPKPVKSTEARKSTQARKSTGSAAKPPMNLKKARAVKSGRFVAPPPVIAQRSVSSSPDPLSLPADSLPVTEGGRKRKPEDSVDGRGERRKRSRRTESDGASPSSPESGTSTPDSAKKQSRTTLAVEGRETEDDSRMMKAPLIVGDNARIVSDSQPKELDERLFKHQQRLLPCHLRQIAGPSYDLHDEFPQTLQAAVQKRERAWKKLHPDGKPPLRDGYKLLYEQMIYDANSKEFPPGEQPTIRIIPLDYARPTDYSSPEFELCYTNRVIYADGIVPDQASGCGCIGDCGNPENRKTCACLQRQIAASTTRVGGGPRSGHQDFAYNEHGLLDEKFADFDDPIIECNSQCGCGDGCINRVVGKKKALSIDIFRTEDKGWGIRNPYSYNDPLVGSHVQRTIKKGEPLGIYAGELIPTEEAALRDTLVYSKTHRCYTYSLDSWTIGEDYKALAPKVDADKMIVPSINASHVVAPRAVPTCKKSSKLGRKPKVTPDGRAGSIPIAKEPNKDDDDDEGFTSIYDIDAFSYGNWTRFANHTCEGFNILPRAVYVDERNVTRPLWVYVAHRDIEGSESCSRFPGDEITISYFGKTEPRLAQAGLTSTNQWQRCAQKLRQEIGKNFRCYCKKPLCRGTMFQIAEEAFYNKYDN